MNKDYLVRGANEEDATAIAQIHVDAWRSTYGSLIPQETLNDLSYEQRANFWTSQIRELECPAFIIVAEDPGYGLIGFVTGGRNRDADEIYSGELYAIYLREHYQRRGIGRALVCHAARSMKSSGIQSMVVWVLEDNPFRAFYESLGGQQVSRRLISIGEASLREVAYGWEQLSGLIDQDSNHLAL